MDVLTTRKFTFSAAHRYWLPQWSPERNAAVFGKCTSPYGHGHNYTLFVSVAGPVDPVTGMVMNVVDLKQLVNAVLEGFDHKHLNEDTPYFRDQLPTTENIVRVLWELIAPQVPAGVRLAHLKLYETDDLFAEYAGGAEAAFSRQYEFSAAHRLHAPHLSDAANLALYGKCNNPNGHGHNYRLEVTVCGPVDATTGMVIDMVALDAAVHTVLEDFDHKHLDREVPEFATRASTAEHIIVALWQRLQTLLGARLSHLRLWETPNNVFDYPPIAL